jgi:hypothetical protein
MCPFTNADGAMLPIEGNTDCFVHVLCAIQIPELYIKDGSVCNVKNIDPRRYKGECMLCQQDPYITPLIRCSARSCPSYFHPMCARRASFQLKHKKNKQDTLEPKVYCNNHKDPHTNGDESKGEGPALCTPMVASKCEEVKEVTGANIATDISVLPLPVDQQTNPSVEKVEVSARGTLFMTFLIDVCLGDCSNRQEVSWI